MPRRPKMWEREGRGWYTTIGGKQIPLGKDRKEAEREFARLILGRSPVAAKLTCAEMADRWLDNAKPRVSPKTFKVRLWTLQRWSDHAGRLKAHEVRPYHVTAWLDSQPTWGPPTRSMSARIVKTAFNWAVKEGYLEVNPLASLTVPGIKRSPSVSESELERWLRHVADPALADWIAVGLGTGLRPGEQERMRAADVSLEAGSAAVAGKSGKRTVYFSDAARTVLERLARQFPDGRLFRAPTPRRAPWNHTSLARAFREVSAKAGVKVVPKTLRKVFATRSLRANGEVITAKLLGHTGLGMLAAHYATPEESDLRRAARQADAG